MTTDAELENALRLLGVPPASPASPPLVRPRPHMLVRLEVDGVIKSRRDWALEYGIDEDVIRKRMARGMSAKQAVTVPMLRTNKRRKK